MTIWKVRGFFNCVFCGKITNISTKQIILVDRNKYFGKYFFVFTDGARCSSVVRAFTHGAMGRRIDPSWGGPIELFLVPASAPQLV